MLTWPGWSPEQRLWQQVLVQGLRVGLAQREAKGADVMAARLQAEIGSGHQIESKDKP